MNSISRARITDIRKIKKQIKNTNHSSINFYSEFNNKFLYYILSGNCYLIMGKKGIQSVIIKKSFYREIVYLPVDNKGISFFKLLFLLTKYINYLFVKDYILKLRYKTLDADKYKKYFPISIMEDIKTMKGKTDISPLNDYCDASGLKFRVMELNKDEQIRVELQNKIFNQVKGRRELKIEEVIREESKPGFIKNMCYIIENNGCPIGYGQILLPGDNYYLVNFGIISEYRQKGFGYYFLNQILFACHENGIDMLYLTVDNNNTSALKLYEKAGFSEEYNMLALKL